MTGTTRTLFLARHGETDWNVARRWQGQTDVPLNATGRAQASAIAERMRLEGVASIASSDLSRARETAEIVAEALGLAVGLLDADLREQRFGRFEGLTRGECERQLPEAWARYAVDPRATPPDGESRRDLVERVVPALHRVAERLASPVLVVTHGGVMRAFLAEARSVVAGAAASDGPPAPIANGGLVRVTVAAGRIVEAVRLDEPA